MSKRAILSLMLAILLPLAGYFTVKYYSKDAIHMPGHVFMPDSVIDKTINGRKVTDTIWHQVKNMSFINQRGDTVSLDSLHGKMIVIDLFFTRCASICPKLAMSMKKLQNAYAQSDSIVHFLSISIDPQHDSVQHLRKFADRYGANHDNWWFLTGDKKAIYDFVLNELKASVADTTITPEFVHTDLFFLLDKQRIVRGIYHESDPAAMKKLPEDISLLLLEKKKNEPSFFRSFIPILPVIFVGIGIFFIVMILINRKKNKQS